MFTWISRACPHGLVLILSLVACVPLEGVVSGARSASIMNGEIMVPAPAGYCVDRAASQATESAAVIIMGRCSDKAGVPPAAISATVGAAGSATVLAAGTNALADYFRSSAGRAALSRNGQANAVTVQEIGTVNGAVVLHLTDRALGQYWRAVFGLRGRLVTLAVTAPDGQPLSAAEGRALLLRAISQMRSANADAAT